MGGPVPIITQNVRYGVANGWWPGSRRRLRKAAYCSRVHVRLGAIETLIVALSQSLLDIPASITHPEVAKLMGILTACGADRRHSAETNPA